MVRVSKPGPKRAFPAAKYNWKNHSLQLGSSGEFKVKTGDSVSIYAGCLFGDPMIGWDEFARISNGTISPLIDVSKIRAGETLYHLPSTKQQAVTSVQPGGKHVLTGTELDVIGLHRFFNGVATRVAMAKSARLKWNAEKGSFWKAYGAEVYNLTLGNFFDQIKLDWVPPSAEVTMASKSIIAEEASIRRQQFWDTFITKATESPSRGVQYLQALESVKQSASDNIASIFEDAKSINKGIVTEINRGLRWVAGTKTIANGTVTVLGSVLTGGAPIAIGLAHGSASFYLQFKQGASAFDKTSTVVVTAGGAYTSVWKESLTKVGNTKAQEAEKIAGLLSKADQTTTERLSHSLALQKRLVDAERAAFRASIHNAAGKGLAAFAIGMELNDFRKIWNDTRD